MEKTQAKERKLKKGNLAYSVIGTIVIVAFAVALGVFIVDTDLAIKGIDRDEFYKSYKENIAKRFNAKLRQQLVLQDLSDQANAAFEERKWKDARKFADEAVKADPSNAAMHKVIAICAERIDGEGRGMAYVESLSNELKQTKEIQQAIAKLAANNNAEQALKIYRELAAKYPDDIDCLKDAGFAELELDGDSNNAKGYFDSVIKLDAKNESAYNGLLSIAEDRTEKKSLLNKLIGIDSKNSNYTGQLGWMEYEDGDYERARTLSMQAVATDPTALYSHFNQALAELRLGMLPVAWETYVQATASGISQEMRYPFIGAADDLNSLPKEITPDVVGKIRSLLEYGESLTTKGMLSYMDRTGDDAFVFGGPDFISAKHVSLANYKGKFVFVDFWATWCGPCLGELPNVVALQKALGGDKFQVVSVSLDEKGADEELKKIIAENGINYPVIYNGTAFDGEDAKAYKVTYIPNTWVISPEGKILFRDLRDKDPLKYCKALLENPNINLAKVEIEAKAEKSNLSFKVTSGTPGVKAAVVVLIPYEFLEDKKDSVFIERHSFSSETDTLEGRVDFPQPEDTLPFIFYSVEVPVAGMPEPIRQAGVVTLSDSDETNPEDKPEENKTANINSGAANA